MILDSRHAIFRPPLPLYHALGPPLDKEAIDWKRVYHIFMKTTLSYEFVSRKEDLALQPVICQNPIRIESIDVFISGWQPRHS